MNTNQPAPEGGGTPFLPALLLTAAAAVAAAHSDAWAGAVGTAAAVYSVLITGNDRRN
ncbi:hypothetical protein [Streptomyces virginiae]|uniref:Uncharacterized protein n=1 Tax=Streptomyces virginiae TaxID=1961 RepID=A0ABZ1TQW2_STRVG|nr:hypothetical protein [Streptomyces virginiae]